MEVYLAMIVGNNFEEIEAIATVDILRRAGIKIDLISLYNQPTLVGAHGIKVLPDCLMTDFDAQKYHGLVIPGGMGVDQGPAPLLESEQLVKIVQEFSQANKFVSAICAAPQVLGKAGVLEGKEITHFPNANQFLETAKQVSTTPAVIDGNLVTGASAGSAVQFALAIVEHYQGSAKKEALAQQLVMNYR